MIHSLSQNLQELNPNLGPNKKVILILDGGGIRGVAEARILCEIERRTGRFIHELFNVVVGTSTGGLISTLLTIPTTLTHSIMSGEQIVELYQECAGDIFEEKFIRKFYVSGFIDKFRNSRYTQEGLERVLDALYDPKTTLADVKEGVQVGLCISDAKARQPMLFNSFRAVNYPDDWRHGAPLRTLVKATSAAPTYFPHVDLEKPKGEAKGDPMKDSGLIAKTADKLKRISSAIQNPQPYRRRRPSIDWYDKKDTYYHRDKLVLEDGGMTRNNPSTLAFKFAKKLILYADEKNEGYDVKNMKLLSLGTGSVYFDADKNEMDPAEWKDIQEMKENEENAKKNFMARGFNWTKNLASKIFFGASGGYWAMGSRFIGDPFDLDQNLWNTHYKMIDIYDDEKHPENYIRVQYPVTVRYLKEMSAHEKVDVQDLIRSAENFLFDSDRSGVDAISPRFREVLKLVDPDYSDDKEYKEDLLEKRMAEKRGKDAEFYNFLNRVRAEKNLFKKMLPKESAKKLD